MVHTLPVLRRLCLSASSSSSLVKSYSDPSTILETESVGSIMRGEKSSCGGGELGVSKKVVCVEKPDDL